MEAHNSPWYRPALAQLVDCVNNKRSALDVVQRANDEGQHIGQPGELIVCFASAGLALIDAIKRNGITFGSGTEAGEMARMDSFSAGLQISRQLAQRDMPGLSASMRGICLALDAASQAGVKMNLPAEEPAPAPPVPLQCVIVGMPDRSTQTTITRDGSGAIIGSTQIEKDAG
jgi:hypothetical protein